MRQRFCKVCRGWHELGEPWPEECVKPEPTGRSILPFPMIVRDEMEPGVHPYDMRTYDSKSGWRKANRMGGYVEVGNDPQRFNTPKKAEPKGIRETLMKAKAKVGI